jgi:hypothetical protein
MALKEVSRRFPACNKLLACRKLALQDEPEHSFRMNTAQHSSLGFPVFLIPAAGVFILDLLTPLEPAAGGWRIGVKIV